MSFDGNLSSSGSEHSELGSPKWRPSMSSDGGYGSDDSDNGGDFQTLIDFLEGGRLDDSLSSSYSPSSDYSGDMDAHYTDSGEMDNAEGQRNNMSSWRDTDSYQWDPSVSGNPWLSGYDTLYNTEEAAHIPMSSHLNPIITHQNMRPDITNIPSTVVNVPVIVRNLDQTRPDLDREIKLERTSPPPPPTPSQRPTRRPNNKPLLPDFMAEIMNDSRYNPSVIRWLNQRERVFIIVKPKLIAEMWGKRKGNPNMNYPNMSRGMRDRRQKGYFVNVPADARYPKKLTYKWGPMSEKYFSGRPL